MSSQSFIRSFIRSFIHPLIHSFSHPFSHQFMHSFISSFMPLMSLLVIGNSTTFCPTHLCTSQTQSFFGLPFTVHRHSYGPLISYSQRFSRNFRPARPRALGGFKMRVCEHVWTLESACDQSIQHLGARRHPTAKVWLFVGHHFAQVTEGHWIIAVITRAKIHRRGHKKVLEMTLLLWNSLPPSTSKEFDRERFCLWPSHCCFCVEGRGNYPCTFTHQHLQRPNEHVVKSGTSYIPQW